MTEPAAPGGAKQLAAAVEALLVVTDVPLVPTRLAAELGLDSAAVVSVLEGLAQSYLDRGAGFRLRATASGWRLCAAPEHADLVRRLLAGDQPARLTTAALETLAIVAYRQPVSRARIAGIRGVSVDGVLRTLQSRGLVREAGAEPGSGALLYVTTELFLDRLGLTDLQQLPDLGPLLPDVEDVSAEFGLGSS